MRWLAFILLALVTVALQISVGAALRVKLGSSGLTLQVDFMAILAVMTALRVRHRHDVLLAAWLLGLLIDLSVVRSPIGLYALGFALGAGGVYHARAAVFGQSPLAQVILAAAFCLLAYAPARVFLNLYVRTGAGRLGWDLLQLLLVAVCTGVCAPVIGSVFRRLDRLILVPAGRRR